MARNRNIYQSDILYVGPTGTFPATGKHFGGAVIGGGEVTGSNLVAELFRVQTCNYTWNKTLRDVNQFGELGAIDRIPVEQPTVTLNFSYLLANLVNEKLLGFNISTGTQVTMVSGILNGLTDNKNYFLRTVDEGNDAVGVNEGTSDVVAIGNGFISSYTAEGSVGDFPRATVDLEGLNIKFDNVSSGGYIPAVNPTDGTAITGFLYALTTATQNVGGQTINTSNTSLSVLRPGDITLSLGLTAGEGHGGWLESDLKVQNFSFSFNLARENLEKLGSKYAFAKIIQFPAQATLNVTANVGDAQTGSLVEMINNNTTFNPSVTIRKPGTTDTVVYYNLRGAKLDSQDVSESIGPSKSVTMQFSSQIAGPQSTNGCFCSGAN